MNKFKIEKKQLKNGMTILVRPTHHIPEVDIQIWYDVGSKDECAGERGMAHLIEHMMFKGTEKLSESDINLITHKLSGYSNAFTSYDYTGYLFKFPKNVWHESLPVFAECMQNARFEEQMLFSEMQAVIQELKMYKDDYQSSLIERMMATIFSEHPYHYPIIGYKHNLLSLKRDNLYSFYKKHYYPANATLVIVGAVDSKDVFKRAEKIFGHIASPEKVIKPESFFHKDIERTSVTLYRAVENSWCFYAYKTPGLSTETKFLFDMAALILGNGRSSRLFKKLVNEKQLVVDVSCFAYDLFEAGLFFIAVQPKNEKDILEIEKIIKEEITNIINFGLKDWEFTRIKKKAQMDYLSLLESNNRQASTIGETYLATGKIDYIDTYLEKIQKATTEDLQNVLQEYLSEFVQHIGYLLPAKAEEKKKLISIQEQSDELDKKILEKNVRTKKVEDGKAFESIEYKPLEKFDYPKPKTFRLENGLEVIYLNNPHVPQTSMILNFQANFLYEPEKLSGISTLTSNMLLEGTITHPGDELSKFIESQGIQISSSTGNIALKLLSADLQTGFNVLREIVTEPGFEQNHVDKIKNNMLIDLQEFWDTPVAFVNQLARDIIYKSHPYRKNSFGTKETVSQLKQKDIFDFYGKYISPQGATLVVVGDLNQYKQGELEILMNRVFKEWKGNKIEQLILPKISYNELQTINYEIDRDQVVLAFAAPSITRTDEEYDKLAILDTVLTGGSSGSMSSRLFQLREQTGLFYSIGGSLVSGANKGQGMMLIKTIVSVDKVRSAEKIIEETINYLGEKGISEEELFMAVNELITSSVRLFESNMQIANAFLFIKKCALGFDLFDKRGGILSILDMYAVNNTAKKFCSKRDFSRIRVGRKCW
jgi:zinc protease